jgi:hypothetical protein
MVGAAAPAEVTPEIETIVKDLREAVIARIGPVEKFEINSVLTQVVAGKNIFAKVQVSDKPEFVQLRVYCALPHTGEAPALVGLLKGDEAAGDVKYFEPSS